jgi:hypothetical protein
MHGLAHGKVSAWPAHAKRHVGHAPKVVTALRPPAVVRLPRPHRRRIHDAVFMSGTSDEQGTAGHGRVGGSSPERQRDGRQRRSGCAVVLHGGGEAPVSAGARRWLLQHGKGV